MIAVTFLLRGFIVIFCLHSRTFSLYQNECMFYILFVTHLFALSISCNKLFKKELLHNLLVLRATLFNIKVLRHWLHGTLGGQDSIDSLSSLNSSHLPGWSATNDILRGRASLAVAYRRWWGWFHPSFRPSPQEIQQLLLLLAYGVEWHRVPRYQFKLSTHEITVTWEILKHVRTKNTKWAQQIDRKIKN